LAEEKLGGSQQ